MPKLTRVAAFGTSSNPGNAEALRETETAAAPLNVRIQYIDILTSKAIETGFRAATEGRVDAILVLPGAVVNSFRPRIVELAIKNRLPTIYPNSQWMENNGLMAYGVNRNDLTERAAIYVDKILKGAKPADLPVEQPTKFELVINLKTAKQIGLTIPPNVLARADRVIK